MTKHYYCSIHKKNLIFSKPLNKFKLQILNNRYLLVTYEEKVYCYVFKNLKKTSIVVSEDSIDIRSIDKPTCFKIRYGIISGINQLTSRSIVYIGLKGLGLQFKSYKKNILLSSLNFSHPYRTYINEQRSELEHNDTNLWLASHDRQLVQRFRSNFILKKYPDSYKSKGIHEYRKKYFVKK